MVVFYNTRNKKNVPNKQIGNFIYKFNFLKIMQIRGTSQPTIGHKCDFEIPKRLGGLTHSVS